jgi:syntaxin 5
MCDDRTAEFLSLARALPPSNATPTTAPSASGRYGTPSTAAHDDLRAFHKTAANISKDIAATSAMLSQLTQLVRQKSLFDEDSSAIHSLVISIKANIENLNSRLDQAGTVLQHQKRRLNTQAGQEATNLVGQLKEEFVKATAGFKAVLQQRTDGLKDSREKQNLVYGRATSMEEQYVSLDNKPPVYSSAPSSSQFPTLDLDLTSGMSAGESTSSTPQLPRPHGVAGHGGGSSYSTPAELRHRMPSAYHNMPSFSGGTSSYNDTPLTPLDIQRMEQETEMMQLIPDQSYLRERADAMSTVESNIVELGTIFNKLAVMVSQHREMVQRVEDNVDDVESNVNLSMAVLTDTLNNLRTNRALFAKVFSIIVVFIIMFIVFFA